MVGDDAAERLKQQFRSYESGTSQAGSSSSGGEPPWTPLERRVAKLEDDVGDIKQTLRALEPRIIEMHTAMQPMREDIASLKVQTTTHSKELSEVKVEVAEVKGMVSKLPSVATTILVVVGILGMTFAGLSVLSFLKP